MRIRRFRPPVLTRVIARSSCFTLWPTGLLITLFLLMLPPAASQTTPGQVVIQSNTHLVQVNVVADKHGKPIGDLRRDDFVLLDNNQEQKISFLALEDASVDAMASFSSPGQMTFSNRPASNTQAVTVFLFDELNTAITDQQSAKKDFLRYLRELPAESRVSVFVLGDSLVLLHDFSQDMASLLATMEKHQNRINPEVTAATAPPASANSLTGGVANTTEWDTFIAASNQPYIDYTKTVRAIRTAEALETIAGHVQGIPGRKR